MYKIFREKNVEEILYFDKKNTMAVKTVIRDHFSSKKQNYIFSETKMK